MSKEVNNFDVLKTMSERDLDIGLGPDFIRGQVVKKGAELTFGVPEDWFHKVALAGNHTAVVLIFDRTQFEEIKEELSKS